MIISITIETVLPEVDLDSDHFYHYWDGVAGSATGGRVKSERFVQPFRLHDINNVRAFAVAGKSKSGGITS